MTLDFMKSGVIAPSMHPPNWRVFVETSDFIRLWVDFTWNPLDFTMKIHRISWMWAFAWWSSIGLSIFERPTRRNLRATLAILIGFFPYSIIFHLVVSFFAVTSYGCDAGISCGGFWMVSSCHRLWRIRICGKVLFYKNKSSTSASPLL